MFTFNKTFVLNLSYIYWRVGLKTYIWTLLDSIFYAHHFIITETSHLFNILSYQQLLDPYSTFYIYFKPKRLYIFFPNQIFYLVLPLPKLTQLWARICRPFEEPSNQFPAWRASTTTLFSYRPAEPQRLTESISQNRFLGSINDYKYGLSLLWVFHVHYENLFYTVLYCTVLYCTV
jgi:hypothetical protein